MKKYKNNEEALIDLYGEKKGKEIHKRDTTVKLIMQEAIHFVEKRWKEEFPDEDLSKENKPYAYAWFNNRPKGC
jgi:hypothetical protein